jgi:arginyl-tRNA synthetase
MMSAREELLDALRAAMAEVSPGHTLAAAFETPKQADHGDLAVTAAMPLAKAQRRNPREVAAELIAALRAKTAVERWVESIAVAGPGFINLHCAPRRASASSPRRSPPAPPSARGRRAAIRGSSSSSRPTRPARCTSATRARPRSATRSATCSRRRAGRVVREFYYNDAASRSRPWRRR